MQNLNPMQSSESFVGRFERFARPARYPPSGYYEDEKISTVEREYSKKKNNYQKLIKKNRKGKAPYLAQYTKIVKVIKRFRTTALTDIDQWQFILKLSGHVSFIILNLCTKNKETLTKVC